ncbi:MAG UNVERIFIED_CONTAM: hypothetical protein LVQ98_08990 [Rickettsiaceae bacterium]
MNHMQQIKYAYMVVFLLDILYIECIDSKIAILIALSLIEMFCGKCLISTYSCYNFAMVFFSDLIV